VLCGVQHRSLALRALRQRQFLIPALGCRVQIAKVDGAPWLQDDFAFGLGAGCIDGNAVAVNLQPMLARFDDCFDAIPLAALLQVAGNSGILQIDSKNRTRMNDQVTVGFLQTHVDDKVCGREFFVGTQRTACVCAAIER
jgi:hypothetical protein